MQGENSIRNLYESMKYEKDTSVSGYLPPTTCHYLSQDNSFPKAKRKFFEREKDIYLGLDPGKYSEDNATSLKKYWMKPSGEFVKSKKESILDQSLRPLKDMPGPGTYFKSKSVKVLGPLGKFGKEERVTFIMSTQAKSQDTPSCWKYTPYHEKTKKDYQNGIYHAPYFKEPKKPKVLVGPGSYNPDKSVLSQVLNKTITFPLGKEKKKDLFTLSALQKSFIPGVGSYPNADLNSTMQYRLSKKKPIIVPYQFERISEVISKLKSWVPGPGSYNIGPLPRIYNPDPAKVAKAEKEKKKLKNSKTAGVLNVKA